MALWWAFTGPADDRIGQMKRPRLHWVFLGLFAAVLSVWLYQGFTYPYAVYEYRETGRILEYLDRLTGREVGAIPIFIPDNPFWVDLVRRFGPFALFALGLAVIYFLVSRREAC